MHPVQFVWKVGDKDYYKIMESPDTEVVVNDIFARYETSSVLVIELHGSYAQRTFARADMEIRT